MPVVISMLRGVNVGGHNCIKMDLVRAIYESLGFQDVRTYVQSGNVVFRAEEKDPIKLRSRIEAAIEKKAGFRPDVIIRSTAEMRKAVARNPFAKRRGIDPRKFLVVFLAGEPQPSAKKQIAAKETQPDELYLDHRELYIYFFNGMANPKIAWMSVVKTLDTTGTGRNWNSVIKLLEMAEELENAK